MVSHGEEIPGGWRKVPNALFRGKDDRGRPLVDDCAVRLWLHLSY